MSDATEITNVVFSALSDRNGFDHWFDQIDDELQAEIKTEIAEAIAALRAQPAGWIAVSERLPRPWDAVMVHPRPNDYVNEAYLNHKGVWMYSEYVTDFGDQAYPCVVTHWMPLPPPPGQERAEPDHSYEFPSAPKHHDLIAELRKPMHYLSMAKRNRAADALEGKL